MTLPATPRSRRHLPLPLAVPTWTVLVLAALGVLVALAVPVAAGATSRAAGEEEGATHDSFSAVVRVRTHGRCLLEKSDAAARASLRCHDGLRTRVRPCPQRESRRCFWHAPTRADGAGHSFLAFEGRRYRFRA